MRDKLCATHSILKGEATSEDGTLSSCQLVASPFNFLHEGSENMTTLQYRMDDAKELKSITGALLIAYIRVQFSSRRHVIVTDKYVCLPFSKIKEDLLLSRREQETARNLLLKKGWIAVKKIGIPCTQHICITEAYLEWVIHCCVR